MLQLLVMQAAREPLNIIIMQLLAKHAQAAHLIVHISGCDARCDTDCESLRRYWQPRFVDSPFLTLPRRVEAASPPSPSGSPEN